ncbi:hypothetical protein [Eubacterium ruminantium]|uniref:hypothetical protein n=1 Tax=Eubacterium ruminantium TaxID=42322 RepID=UPI0023F356CF|nr:hypothetical protein [Eubacterium ruminantium]
MEININIKNMGKKGRRIQPVPFEYEKIPSTAEELIEETVKIMVNNFINRQKWSEEGHVPDPLTEERIKSMAEIGKVAFGYVYNDKKPDMKKAVDTALLAYEDGMVRLFINGEDVEFRKEGTSVSLSEGDEVTFVRLAMLAGRIW